MKFTQEEKEIIYNNYMSFIDKLSDDLDHKSGIYLDNELWTEHHSLHTCDWAELINNHHLESVDVKEVCGEWLEECGNLPQRYQDIPMGAFV